MQSLKNMRQQDFLKSQQHLHCSSHFSFLFLWSTLKVIIFAKWMQTWDVCILETLPHHWRQRPGCPLWLPEWRWGSWTGRTKNRTQLTVMRYIIVTAINPLMLLLIRGIRPPSFEIGHCSFPVFTTDPLSWKLWHLYSLSWAIFLDIGHLLRGFYNFS